MKQIVLFVCFFPSFIDSSGIFIKSMNVSYHPDYVEDFVFSITKNPKDDLDYVMSGRGILKKRVSWIQARGQVYTKRGKIFDYNFDVCQFIARKNSGDIFYGYLKKLMKSMKGVKLECPMEPVSKFQARMN